MSITDILIIAVVGMLVVFSVLVILMFSIKLMALVFKKLDKVEKVTENESDTTTTVTSTEPAPGSCGNLLLENVSDKDAAMIMAIIADKLKTPLCELKFISIKQVEEK